MKTININIVLLLLVSPSYALGLPPGFNPYVPVLCQILKIMILTRLETRNHVIGGLIFYHLLVLSI